MRVSRTRESAQGRVRIATRSRGGVRPEARVAAMFADSTRGAWYDPSDLATMFQDPEGTTPVSSVEQWVGLLLDKSGRGNHLSQLTPTARPRLSARHNFVNTTDLTNDTYWNYANGTRTGGLLDSQGLNTAVRLEGPSSSPAYGSFIAPATKVVYEIDVLVEPGNPSIGQFLMYNGTQNKDMNWVNVRLSDGTMFPQIGTGTMSDLGGNWRRLRIEQNATISPGDIISYYFGEAGTSPAGWTCTVARPELRISGTWVEEFQSVASPGVYEAEGFPKYLRFDGLDDLLVTSAPLDLSGAGKTVSVSGLTNLSDDATAFLYEHGNYVIDPGIAAFAPTGAAATYGVGMNAGVSNNYMTTPNSFSVPNTAILGGRTDSTTSDEYAKTLAFVDEQESGVRVPTYGSQPLISARFGLGGRPISGGYPLNAFVYGLILLARDASPSEFTALHMLMRQRMQAGLGA